MVRSGVRFWHGILAIGLALLLATGCTNQLSASRSADQAADPTRATLGVSVNSYLWRAALDTISFMPLSSADPFGGVIITDWYTPPESGEERFKMTVYILDKTLRADAVRVAIFKQRRERGSWADTDVDPRTAVNLENQILSRARSLRLQSQGGTG